MIEEFEILKHEQAHEEAAEVGAGCDLNVVEGEEASTLSQRNASVSNSEYFLDKFAGMINHNNLQSILLEQDHM